MLSCDERLKRTPVFQNIQHVGFFVLRTPLLPAEEMLDWSEGLLAAKSCGEGHSEQGKDAWQADVSLLRQRLHVLLDRPEITHALFVATPSLQPGIAHWKRDPNSKKGMQAERALVRYLLRMAGRSTPFGLFSGCSTGKVADDTVASPLVIKPRGSYKSSTRLDYDYLFELSESLQKDPAVLAELPYWPNSSLHRCADS